jgi:hypothetical protein
VVVRRNGAARLTEEEGMAAGDGDVMRQFQIHV